MWREPRMWVLVVVTATAYAALLVPFDEIVIIPGVTSVRPANALPVVFGLLFGPAAAWGSAFGNLGSELVGGTLTAGSSFGFVGNFVFGLLSYKLWGNFGPLSSHTTPDFRGAVGRQLLEFLVVAVTVSAASAAIIAWGLDFLGFVPFSTLGPIIFLNNLIPALLLGPPLLYLLYPRLNERELVYPALLSDGAVDTPDSRRARLAAFGLVCVSVGWLVVGVVVSIVGAGAGASAGGVPPTDAGSGVSVDTQTFLGGIGLVAVFVLSALATDSRSALQ